MPHKKLLKGDYSQWLRNLLKDEDLAQATANVEKEGNLPAEESRARIKDIVQSRYTAPA